MLSTKLKALLAPVALLALLALAASAAAAIYVYKNEFNSAAAYREIDQTGGGKAGCDESYSEGSKSMRIEIGGQRTFCEYSPPVTGDRDQPDHEIVAAGRILEATPDNVKRQSYLAVRVRVGDDTYYDFRVNPKEREFKLNRNPVGGAAGLPITGTSNDIEPLGVKNQLRLRINGGNVAAFVNGKSVATYDDPNPGQVTGRKVAFGVGVTKETDKGPIAVYQSVKVGVPNP